jgi:HEAT repeat protein
MPDFAPYLESVRRHYEQWWRLYTLTDAEGRSQVKVSPFDFGLMVQTIAPKSNPGVHPMEDDRFGSRETIERFGVLEGLRKYAGEHVLLVGRPGSGKSTALARLLLEEAALTPSPSPKFGRGEQDEERGRIPVLVELRYWTESGVLGLIQGFLRSLPTQVGLSPVEVDRTTLEELLRSNRFLLLMDGLNELPSEAARLDVQRFRREFPRVAIVFTTRDLSVGGDFGIEKKLEMQALTETQMRDFVMAYCPEQSEAMLRQLGGRLREFGSTPLLLWMLCGLFQQTGEIPENLGGVFRAFTTGYEQHLKADVVAEVDRRWWAGLLQELAARMVIGDGSVELRVAIDRSEVEAIFTAFLRDRESQAAGAARKALDDLLRHHLIQTNGAQVEFRHQLIQEYYAAEWLLRQVKGLDDATLQQDYLNYLKWTEPVALMLALVEDEDVAVRVVELALDVDLMLGARLAGEVRSDFQEKTVTLVSDREVPNWLKAEMLGKTHSKESITELIRLSSCLDDWTRYCAIDGLAKINIKSEESFTRLLQALKDRDFGMRWRAAIALGEINFKEAVPNLIKSLTDEKWDVRWAAAESLGRLSPIQAIPSLLECLTENEDEALLEYLTKNENENRFDCYNECLDSLDKILNIHLERGGFDDQTEQHLNQSDRFQISFLRFLEKAFKTLREEDSDDCYWVSRALKFFLYEIIPASVYLPCLAMAYSNFCEFVNGHRFTILEFVFEELEGIIVDSNENIDIPDFDDEKNDYFSNYINTKLSIREIIRILSVFQPTLKPSDLIKVLQNNGFRGKLGVIWYLGKFESLQMLIAFHDLLEISYENLIGRYYAKEILKSGLKNSIDLLIDFLMCDEDFSIFWHMIDILELEEVSDEFSRFSEIIRSGNVLNIFSALSSQDENTRWRAACLLGTIGDAKGLQELLIGLTDEDASVRRTALLAIRNIEAEDAVDALKIVAKDDIDETIRSEAIYILKNLRKELALHLKSNSESTHNNAEQHTRKNDNLEGYDAESMMFESDQHENIYTPDFNLLIERLKSKSIDEEYWYLCWRHIGELADVKADYGTHILPELLSILSTEPSYLVIQAITTIQSNCKFYNYEIQQTKPRTAVQPSCLEENRPSLEGGVGDPFAKIEDKLELIDRSIKMSEPSRTFNIQGNYIEKVEGGYHEHNYAPQANLKETEQLTQVLQKLRQQHPNATDAELFEILLNGFTTMPQQNPKNWQSWQNIFSVLFSGGVEGIKIVCPPAGIPIEVGKRLYDIYQKNPKQLPGT